MNKVSVVLFFIVLKLYGQIEFSKGDMMFYALNSNVNSTCIQNQLNGIDYIDELFLITLKDIPLNTVFYITDNGWQRKFDNFFGTTEGVIKLKKKATAYTKGKVFSIKIPGSYNQVNLSFLNPDWEIEKVTNGIFNVALVDQLFIFKDGQWSMDQNESHKGQFLNSIILSAYNNKQEWDSYLDLPNLETTNSGLPGEEMNDLFDITNFHQTHEINAHYKYYKGIKTKASSNEWKLRLMNPINWFLTTNCISFQSINLLEDLQIDDEIKEFKICRDDQITLIVDDNSIVEYQWYENNIPSTENGNIINGATNYMFNPPSINSGTKFYYCDLKYKLKWISQGNLREIFSVLKSALYKVEIQIEPMISSININ